MNPVRRKIIFLTGTRADFGKLKSLMLKLQADPFFDVHVFVTGMHTLAKYGSTWEEVRKAGLINIYRFINQNENDSMDHILAKTVAGFSDYVREIVPDMIVVHGDRLEAMAGAIVGSFNNIKVAHIEGGEVSGTIDEVVRHAISKMAHIHFVANEEAERRLIQLGELRSCIHIIGSPDIDVMNSSELPTIEEVREYYGIRFEKYAILIFHPVTTEVKDIRRQVSVLIDAIISSAENFVVLYPNNDHGTDLILDEYRRLHDLGNIVMYPSMRFEYFLTLMKHADYIVGNSSAGIREAPHFGVPTINLGSRQNNRVKTATVLNVDITKEALLDAIESVKSVKRIPAQIFGHGNSSEAFHEVMLNSRIWDGEIQKYFVDYL